MEGEDLQPTIPPPDRCMIKEDFGSKDKPAAKAVTHRVQEHHTKVRYKKIEAVPTWSPPCFPHVAYDLIQRHGDTKVVRGFALECLGDLSSCFTCR